jgi:hypothetical protein
MSLVRMCMLALYCVAPPPKAAAPKTLRHCARLACMRNAQCATKLRPPSQPALGLTHELGASKHQPQPATHQSVSCVPVAEEEEEELYVRVQFLLTPTQFIADARLAGHGRLGIVVNQCRRVFTTKCVKRGRLGCCILSCRDEDARSADARAVRGRPTNATGT